MSFPKYPVLLLISCLLFFAGDVYPLQPPGSSDAAVEPQSGKADSSGDYEVALRIYAALIKEQGEANLFFSPWSVRQAMALCYRGAKGRTADELKDALSFPEQTENLANLFSVPISESDVPPLQAAAGLWVQKGMDVNADFKRDAIEIFRADFRKLDFATDSSGAVQAINEWVERHTRGMIPVLFDKLEANDRMVVGSAVYFNAAWKTPFDSAITKEGTFFPEKGEAVAVPMMSQTVFSFCHFSDECQIVELPYAGTGISFVALLPGKEKSLNDLERMLEATFLTDRLESGERKRIALGMPKFSATQSCTLDSTLKSIGIRSAFSDKEADFSGMTSVPVYLAQVRHKASLVVDEKGTEASATTAVRIQPKMALPDPVEITLDKPFVYMILDRQRQTIYFMGRYATPEKSGTPPSTPVGGIME